MSKFHRTLSRRDFMKGLGLGAAGFGAAAASVPVFHDVDELTSSYTVQKPWWVKERDYEDITTEVDWNIYDELDRSATTMPNPSDENAAMRRERDTNWDNQGMAQKLPGRDTRCMSLSGVNTGICPTPDWNYPEPYNTDYKWQDTPENNLQTWRAAMQWMGASLAGCLELNDHMKKNGTKGEIVWESGLEAGYRDDNRMYHLPAGCTTQLTSAVQQNYTQALNELAVDESRTGGLALPMALGRPAVHRAYGEGRLMQHMSQRFVAGLGWQAYGCGFRMNVPVGIFSGLGEQGRVTYMGTPTFGILCRRTNFVITDMPVAPSKPIDFGFTKFCETCNRCGECCPGESISQAKETTWEPLPGNRAGYKGWHMDWLSCREQGAPSRCGVCHKQCPFNHPSDSIIHPITRATAATTSLFNSFFASADRIFNYNKPKSEQELADWWHRDPVKHKGDTYYGAGRYVW